MSARRTFSPPPEVGVAPVVTAPPQRPDDAGFDGAPAIVEDRAAGLRVSAVSLANVVLRHLRLVVAVPVLLTVAVIALGLVRGRLFEAYSAFAPETQAGNAQRLAGLAAQFGISAGALSTGESLDFYQDLVRSRTILEQVARRRYRLISGRFFVDTVEGDLLTLYKASGKTEQDRLEAALRVLQRNVSVRISAKSNLVTVVTTAPSRAVAESLNRNILDAVSEFNLNRRQSRARAERQFVADRLTNAQREVRAAEAELESFLSHNRSYQSSPQLMLAYSRLQRQVDMRQQVYLTLAQSHEQARIEEVRNTPVITLVDRPEGSARPARSLRASALKALVAGAVLGVVLAFLVDMLKRDAERAPDEFDELRGRLRRLLRRRKRGEPGAGQAAAGA